MISVIIPSLNEEKYIGACIKSLKDQTIKTPYEIIVVDNNSTDNTKKIAQDMGATVIEEPTRGLARAKNTGARNAKGNILCFIDADCIVPNNHLEKIESLFSRFPRIDALGGVYIYHDGGIFIRFVTDTLRYFYFYHKLVKLLTGIPSMSGGNTTVKKQVFEGVGGFNEKMNSILMPEDLEFSLRLKLKGHKAKLFNELNVITSFRRYKDKPNREGAIRFFETIKILRQNRWAK